ncbi:DHA2 family multidrug resistance protein-like MFS transporter [Prauserella sediminis]|uniref:DHA2 family multidrug resistance protein-like MFS transporter n=1 Tax=Prauserella sediminis TaxID=577680 RepID=A0A839XP99_9PSEU|nr:MFS transporter [Prauserella sediminis]MBB3663729.1 DHA2 family multidrug resistance protein-like MFS transporter [Prauserella sediminis]
MSTTTSTSARPTWRAWTGLALLALPLFMMATDFTVMFLAMPAVTADLLPSTTQTLWILHIGEFVAAGFVIAMGWLTGRIGPRTLLLFAIVLYGTASTLAAFAPDAETLLTARVLIGLAAAAASPAAISMLRSLFGGSRHFGIAFAVLMGTFSAGSALGPPMGGMLLEHFWWGSVFLINVPVAAVVLLGGPWVFPKGGRTTAERIDMTSVVLSMGAVILVVFGLQEIADRGPAVPYVLATLVGLVLGTWFVRRQRRLANPLLDLGLFAIRTLRVTAIAFVLSSAAFVAVDFLLLQYLQIVAGVPTDRLGLLLAAPGIAAVLGTAVTPILARWVEPARLMASGVGLALVGAMAVIWSIAGGTQQTWLSITGTTVVSLGVTPLMMLGAQLIVTAAPAKRTGSAVAVQDISAGLGGALGMAFIGSLAMAVFGRVLTAGAADGLTGAELDTAAQNPGSAVAVAGDLGGADGQALLTAAHDALSWGTVAAYGTAVVLGIATIVLVVRGLRGARLDTAPDEPDASTDDTAHPDRPRHDPAPSPSAASTSAALEPTT